MLDAVGGMIDSIAGGLEGKAPPVKDEKPVFHIGPAITTPEARAAGAVSPKANGSDNAQNQFGTDAPTEFVHFGATHEDVAPRFHHKESDIAHGVMFRDALEREALLLHRQIDSAKGIFKWHADSQGALGDIAKAASALFGSGSSGPDLSRFDELMKRVTEAGGKINKKDADYPTLHKAGMDLHAARANYAAFVVTMADAALKKEKSGPLGGLPDAGAMIAKIPGVGKAVSFVHGLIFKGQNVSLKMYLAFREEYEDVIDEASYKITLASIKNKAIPTFHVWFKPPPPPKEVEEAKAKGEDPPANAVEKAIADAKKEVEEAKKKVEDAKKSVDEKIQAAKDFLSPDKPDEPTPGDEFLNNLFASFNSGKKDKRLPDKSFRKRKKAPSAFADGIAEAIDLGPLPGFIQTVLTKITEKDLALLHFILKRAMQGGLTMDFSQDTLRKLGREYFFDTLLDILVEKFSFLQDSPDGLFSVQGQKITKQAFLEKGRDLLRDKFGHYLDSIIMLAMDNTGAMLRESIEGARDKNSLTMEVLLGRLPEMAATLVRDTMLPVFDLLFDELFAKALGPLGKAMSPVKGWVSKAKDISKDAKDAKDKAQRAADMLSSGTSVNSLDDFSKIKDQVMGSDAAAAAAGSAGGNFPGGKREVLCVGKEVKAEDIEKVEKEQKIEAEVWPEPPAEEEEKAAAGAGAAA